MNVETVKYGSRVYLLHSPDMAEFVEGKEHCGTRD